VAGILISTSVVGTNLIQLPLDFFPALMYIRCTQGEELKMNNQIKDVSFFKGGKAIFTVGNAKNEHYTFRINQPKGENKPFFVSMLTGPQNTSDFTYLGLYNPNNLNVYLTTKSKYKEESTPVKVIRWAIRMVANKGEVPAGYKIVHEGKCCRCGRTLTTPESVENGIGPECIKMRG
jgi:hypothetical protein